jgi:hypothetical protein
LRWLPRFAFAVRALWVGVFALHWRPRDAFAVRALPVGVFAFALASA